ncbi:SRPBCC family protein [Candidatus Leptofilum sp.]|uniref:SRPBCC family protein n=1 Tax=Candidatus Leptofilum sp. TaxID=3241576 RepID=UPI003B596164
MLKLYEITHATEIQASPEIVWQHVIDVDIAAFDHPAYFALLDIPKPLNAEVTKPGVGGRRVAYFANGRTFTQTIITWQPHTQYDFTFQASPNFRAGYLLNLADGPFQMKSGSYKIVPQDGGVRLFLTSQYQLCGIRGFFLAVLVRQVLNLFQRYLLRGIKANAEREAGHA